MSIKNLNRRRFVKVAASSLAAIPLVVIAQDGAPSENQKLALDDPIAVSLGYTENSAEVDSATYPNHDVSQNCAGCTLYLGGDDAWGGCQVFAAKQVPAAGWCAAYVAKPA